MIFFVGLSSGGPAVLALQVLSHEGVVELGVDGVALDVVDGGLEHGFLAGQHHGVAVGVGGVVVILREGDHHVEGLAGLVTDDLGQEIIHISGGTGGYGGAGAIGVAAGELHAVHAAHVVDVHLIAVLNGTVGDLGGGSVLLHEGLTLALQVLLGGVDLIGGDGDVLVVGQGHVIGQIYVGPLAVLGQVLGEVDLHLGSGADGRRVGRSGSAGAGAAGRSGAAAGDKTGGHGNSQGQRGQTDHCMFQRDFLLIPGGRRDLPLDIVFCHRIVLLYTNRGRRTSG